MSSEFQIDLPAVRQFYELLSDCGGGHGDVCRYASANKYLAEDTGITSEFFGFETGTYHSGGGEIWPELVQIHQSAYQRSRVRMGYVGGAIADSAEGVRKAADWYEKTDHDNATRLDAQYEPVSVGQRVRAVDNGPSRRPTPVPSATAFHYEPVTPLLDKPDISDLDEDVCTLERVVDWISEKISVYYWVTQIVKEICNGYDVFDEGIKAIAGDWKEWARAAVRWQNCGKAYGVLAENVARYRKVSDYWSGNAADAAMQYFGRLTSAVGIEVDFYDLLYKIYSDVVKLVRISADALELLYGFLFDGLVTMGAGAATKSLKVINFVVEVVSTIGDVITGLQIAIETTKGFGAARTSSGGMTEPPLLAQEFDLSTEPYQHPEVEY